ncbi:MAG: response regulator [Alphaproteobacteria bacterium]|nr:response regulator [Alphaproteobacteria bacterium]
MSTYLTMFGCSYVIADGGADAIKAPESNSYDVILMDCQMPELDGYEATRRIRRREAASNALRSPSGLPPRNAAAPPPTPRPGTRPLSLLSSSVHGLKSSSGNVGATRLAAMCRMIEFHAQENNFEAAQACLTSLFEEFDRVNEALLRETEIASDCPAAAQA